MSVQVGEVWGLIYQKRAARMEFHIRGSHPGATLATRGPTLGPTWTETFSVVIADI